MRTTIVTVLALASASAFADTPKDVGSDAAPVERKGLAIGVEAGEPTSVTGGFFAGKLALFGALGTGTREGVGIQLHVDAQLIVAQLRPDVPVRVGLGGRYYHHGYESMSTDELPDSHYGIRASAAIAYEKGSMELYAELAPGIDVKRTNSCSLASGAYSVCPHSMESPFFLQLVLGARWFLTK
jgi:hypothetical protein